MTRRKASFGGRYRGKVAVVTGASRGLGRAIAMDLARAGAVVVGVARNETLLDELARRMAAVSPGSSTVCMDIGDAASFQRLLARVETERGRIDVLVNNAAVDPGLRLSEITMDDFRRTFEVNTLAAIAGTLAVLPGMYERGEGVIVNVGSDGGRLPAPGPGAYPSSKAALAAFSESIWYRARLHGVAVHVLYPAWMPTDMGLKALERGLRRPPRPLRRSEEEVARLLLRRMGGAELEISVSRITSAASAFRALYPRTFRRARSAWESNGRRRRRATKRRPRPEMPGAVSSEGTPQAPEDESARGVGTRAGSESLLVEVSEAPKAT